MTASTSKDTPQLSVTTQSKSTDVGITTLLGDYTEAGMNHGRKYFKKAQKIKGHEDVSVFLYYWDARDGVEFGGWWFGDQLGGSQVWARCNSHGAVPPRIGWKCPWDAAKAEPGILFVDPYSGKPSGTATTGVVVKPPGSTGAAAATAPADNLTPAERVTRATSQCSTSETEGNEVLAKAKELMAGEQPSEESLKEATELLSAAQRKLVDVQSSLTKDITEARKAGASATKEVTELSKLSPKVRAVQANVTTELNKARGALTKLQAASKAAEAKEQQKKAEEHDLKDLEESLPMIQEQVTLSETSVNAVMEMANPLLSEPPEEGSDALKLALEEIEKTATEAQDKISEARKQINLKLQGARSYAPEARKKALAECSVLQQKLTEAQTKLNPFKTFQKDFRGRVEAKKQLTEISEKLENVEVETEKATMVTSMAEKGEMSDEEVTSAEEIVTPLQKELANQLRLIEQKLRQSTGPMKDELTLIREKGMGSQKKLNTIVAVLRKQKERKVTAEMLAAATEKIEKAEESLTKCQEAEMPFLKGLEILPQEESTKAIADSEAAATKAELIINQAKTFARTKAAEVKRLSPDLAKTASEELNQLLVRGEAATKKLVSFKKETSERKMASLLAEVVDSIAIAEKKVAVVCEAAKLFLSDSLDKITTEAIKDATEKTSAVEEEASDAVLTAKKLIVTKQKEAKGGEATAALAKLQARLNAAQLDLTKHLKAAANGDKLIKGKELLQEAEERIQGVEAEVGKVEEVAGPVQGDEGEELSEEVMEELGTAIVNGQKAIKAAQLSVEAQMSTAVPVVKMAMQKLVERTKKATERINAVLTSCKGQKHALLAKAYMKEGQKQTEEVEAAIQKVNDVELPFLKGIEVLPLQEATETIAESEALVASVQSLINDARTFIASKNLEIKPYGAEVSKPVAEEFIKQTERINTSAAKLSQFKRDTEGRKKTAQMQEAGECISKVEVEVKKLVEAVEPFMAESMTEDEASELCEKLAGQTKDVQAKMDETRAFLAARQKDSKGTSAHTETLQKLQERLSDSMVELAKAKKVISDHEQKFASKKVLAEANQMIADMEAEMERTTITCAPLLEHGGQEFLVAQSIQTLASVLRDRMAGSDLTQEQLFAEASKDGADSKMAEDAFVLYLEGLPAVTEREEITFTEERRQAIFKHMDVDKDGFVGLEDFKAVFRRQYTCKQGITLTDVFEISKSKTKGKVEPGNILEAVGNPAKDEATGMTRMECKVLSTGKTGFVTMLGNQGTTYLEAITRFTRFSTDMDTAIAESMKQMATVTKYLQVKTAELTKVALKGPLVEARTELAKLRPKVTTAQANLETLKKKVVLGKKEYLKKEEAERNAHIEARERKAADAMIAEVAAKVEALEAVLKELEEGATPLTSLQGSELEAFATPISVTGAGQKLQATSKESASDARAAVKEQQAKLTKIIKGPMFEAKKELAKLETRISAAEKKVTSTVEAIRASCQSITDARYAEASAAFREEAQRRGLTPEELFAELVPAGEDRIPEAVFCKHVDGLDGLVFAPEHAQLLFKHIEAGGIGRRRFLSLLQQYFVVVRSIAITDDFEIGKAKTIRKADADEVIEVLEGPRTDDKGKVGLTRVRGKSLVDGQEGWITVCGNQGTPFLQEMEKPFYACNEEVALHQEFTSDGTALRTLKKDEVLELLEGPRKETFTPATRVRAKAVSDNVIGWFTAKDAKGVYAEPDGQYYSCITSVAMTDEMDIKNCNVMRKLVDGEVFTVSEGPVEDKSAGIMRVKGKAVKDDSEGWITIKGNAGTVYAEASTKHFTVVEDVALQKQFASADAVTVRTLEKGEAMLALELPKEEAMAPEVRVRCRALSDGSMGWITLKGDNVRPWSPYYSCLKAALMHDAAVADGATLVRQVEAGEAVELLEGPSKEHRMKVRAEKDGAIGWVSLKDKSGAKLFES